MWTQTPKRSSSTWCQLLHGLECTLVHARLLNISICRGSVVTDSCFGVGVRVCFFSMAADACSLRMGHVGDCKGAGFRRREFDAIRVQPALQRSPALALSAPSVPLCAPAVAPVACRAAGFRGCLGKPFTPDGLRQTLHLAPCLLHESHAGQLDASEHGVEVGPQPGQQDVLPLPWVFI